MARKVCAFLCFALMVMISQAEKQQQDKYAGVDVDPILKNPRILNNYIKCMLEMGSCTPDALNFRKTLPDAIRSGCEKCNQKQRETANKIIKHLMEHRSSDWEKLLKKYDPEGKFKTRFEAQGGKL
ncbi:hypothetical protein QAD02_001381 [Eretmocerus hayati]|uniref:Uncharacterized protein n=1 Tax=Eretmocerus hayati TaxID=131215 RepID=A0ACC2NIQ0_9HYME|nr:hypothetical protein QAD02_001381 [Eretmocerus hayati]